MTLGSLFAGIGGFDLGFERAGFEIRWQVEIDPFCQAVLAKHWPHVKRYGDICTLTGDELEAVDLVLGGDPCQRNSNAWRHGDGSPSLGGEFLRVVEALRPRLVLRENPTSLRKDAPWPWWKFRSALEQLGYGVVPFRLRACCAGADYQRDRLFLFAVHAGTERARLERSERAVVADQDERRSHADAAGPDRWYAAPRICRGTDGIPHRMDRLRSLGNAVTPAVAEWIARCILDAEG